MLRLWNLPHRSIFGAATWAEHGDLDKLVSPPEEARYGQEPVNEFAEIIARAFGCSASEMDQMNCKSQSKVSECGQLVGVMSEQNTRILQRIWNSG